MSHHSSASQGWFTRRVTQRRKQTANMWIDCWIARVFPLFRSLALSAAHETAIQSHPLYLQHMWKEIQPGIHVRLQNNRMHRKKNPFNWTKFMEIMVNFACFHSFRAEISAVMGYRIDGAINAWYHHQGQINWEGTRWERKMLAKRLEGEQENKKERPSIMSCTSGLPNSWCWTSSVTVALLGQGSVCFDCRCNEDCHSITTTPISSCIIHAHSAYSF